MLSGERLVDLKKVTEIVGHQELSIQGRCIEDIKRITSDKLA